VSGSPWGIGIGIPGPVEFATGRPVAPPIMPGWDRYPIRDRFEATYGAPVWVDNDVNVMAMGEWRKGVARGHRNVVFVKIGTGIGAGLISDGMPHRGAQGAAGDVGHIQIADERSVTCRCGNVGCLEALAGGQAIARDAELVARAGRSPRLAKVLATQGSLTAREVAWAASHGDPASLELLNRGAVLVGSMLASVVNFFNPSLIVIGGGVANAGDAVLAAIRETIYRRSLPLATRELQIVRSGLGERVGVIGAAVMVADELLGRARLASTLASHGLDPEPAPEAMEAAS
jgi:glucokinase-like ROK family protein